MTDPEFHPLTTHSSWFRISESVSRDRIRRTTWARHPFRMLIAPAARRAPAPRNQATGSRSELLRRLRSIPIGTWSYGWEPVEVRHLGPMAQDFFHTFGLGDTDRRLDLGDAIGVCMATIVELADRVEALESEPLPDGSADEC